MAKIEAIFDACLLNLETGATIEESLKGRAIASKLKGP